MRPTAALLFSLLCAAALAGCAGKAADAPPTDPLPAAPATRQEGFQGYAYLGTAPGCTQSVCSFGGYGTEVYTVPDDADLTALHLVLGHAENMDEAVSWKVWCESDVDDACVRAFGHGHDELPLTLDLPARAPAGARILVQVTAPRMTPNTLADNLLSLTWGQSRVDGTASLVANASVVRPPRLAINVSVDGHSGPCDFVEPACSQYPGGTQFDFDSSTLGGTVVGANLTMTWTSASPLDQELGLDLYGYCRNTCPGSATAHGPSPLRLAADGLAYGDGVGLDPHNWDPVFGRSFAGTRTPVHIEGVLWVQPEDAADGPEG